MHSKVLHLQSPLKFYIGWSFNLCIWSVALLCNKHYLSLFPDMVVPSRTWQVSVSFSLLLLSLLSTAKSQPLLIPIPFSPALSFQHYFDTDGSPIFTCISHFPQIADCLTSLPTSQTHNFDVKVSLLKNWTSYLFFPISSPCHYCWQYHYPSQFSRFQISWPIQLFSPSLCLLRLSSNPISTLLRYLQYPPNAFQSFHWNFVQNLSIICISYSKFLFKVFFPIF